MSLALQLSPETDNSSTEAENAADTDGVGNSSSALADLVSMFPSLDHEVAVMVLEAHNGSIESAVEYLMNTSGGGPTQPSITGYARLDPAQDMVGKFSSDIGGLPEVLPRCLYEDFTRGGKEEEEEEEGSASGIGQLLGSPLEGSNSLSPRHAKEPLAESDPLPSYSEACGVLSTYTPVNFCPPGSLGGRNSAEGATMVGESAGQGSNIKSKCRYHRYH